MRIPLNEYIAHTQANITLLNEDSPNGGKDLFMKGTFIEGDIKNANGRVYPKREIEVAVRALQEQLSNGLSILGEIDHPSDLNINLDRVTHMITEMWMEGSKGCGKLKIIPTPMGNIIKVMLESGVKLGVSSRGSGEVNESSGNVSGFEIITIDCVAQPSAPHAYPTPIYESLMNYKGGVKLFNLSKEVANDKRVQQYLAKEAVGFIKSLRLK
jgi:hypothetical protein